MRLLTTLRGASGMADESTTGTRALSAKSERARQAFYDRVAELGGSVLEPDWLGVNRPHRVRCAVGHVGAPRPKTVREGQGICRACVQRDPASAERDFRDRVAELGGVVLEPIWLGVNRPHRIRCALGHENSPRPNDVRNRQGICRTCVGNDPALGEKAFRKRLTELGAVLLEPMWLGVARRHRVRCAAGHECMPRPTNVQQGDGICRLCVGKVWDAFYVVADDEEGRLKFGITSGDPRPRLRRHATAGYSRVVRLLVGLPAGVAFELESSVLATLRLAREKPVRGKEYFDDRVMGVVLDIVDNYPIRGRS